MEITYDSMRRIIIVAIGTAAIASYLKLFNGEKFHGYTSYII